jgi:D-lactate dehydrogenase
MLPEGAQVLELLDALEAAAPGRVTDRTSARLAKAHDASHYLLVPELVVTATDADQIAALLRACGSLRAPLTFRSGGTSLSGQAGSDSVLVDTRRQFRAITVLDHGARVRVQPGATVRAVNNRLAAYGTRLGPDPASETACTIGGVVANNSSGMACGTELNTYRTLESAVLVLASGTVIDTGAVDAEQRLAQLEPDLHQGLLGLRDRVRSNPSSVRVIEKQFAMKNTMGYGVNAFLDFDRSVDILAHLVIGSEGTLAFVAEATFRTVPVRVHAATGLVVFDDLHRAARALPDLVAAGFATIELMDATSLRVSQKDPRAPAVLARLEVDAHAALLVEHQEHDAEALASRVSKSSGVLNNFTLSAPPQLTSDPSGRAALWHLRKGLYATVAGNRPTGTTALLEDIAVPVGHLADVCEGLVDLFRQHAYQDSVIFGHAKDGNLHFLLNERFDRPELLDRYLAFTDDMVDMVLGAGGTLKAEHGTGRIMAPFVRRQYGDELYDVMVHVKRLFDPSGILNPGVVISDDPHAHVRHLKTTPTVEEEVDRCVECGFCEPVCPSKDLTLTPRTRIVLRREIAKARARGDEAVVEQLEADYDYEGLDTCAADGMCQTACPVLIDTGSLVTRLRAERQPATVQRAWRSAARHWKGFSRGGSLALSAAARMPSVLPVRTSAAARRVLGEENVPAWTPDLPRGGKPRSRLAATVATPVAVHFAACVGSMFDSPQPDGGAAAAFATLCRRAGVAVTLPPGIDSLCCTTPWKSKGLTDGHNTMRVRVLSALWEATDHGRLPVVSEASSCTEGLERLLGPQGDFPGIQVVDALTFTVTELLPRLPQPTKVRTAALHPTCSTTRLGITDALTTIASALAAHVDVPQDWGCCAFAGDRGMLHPELTASATAAEAAEVNQQTYDLYLSSNRTCEIGLSRATGMKYEHALQALERATRTGPVG